MFAYIIDRDLISDGRGLVGHIRAGCKCSKSEAMSLIATSTSGFEVLDDDGNVYFTGRIGGDYSGFEPLDYLGPMYGATAIRIDGRTL